jgi:myo-inositol-1(or 4)-monophosphatase
MPASYAKFLDALADGSGDILRKYFTKVRRIERKHNAGIVTEADKLSESFLMKKISRNYPDSSIITEESGEFHRSSPLCWILDPLDGTTNYAHGFPWFCVSIGLFEDGKPKAGVVFNPITGEKFTAEAGRGARLNGKRLRVSKTSELRDSLVGTGFYYSKGSRLDDEMEYFRRMNQVALGVRRPGAAALDLACVAAGRFDGFWERGLSPWDVAAGWLLVQEAGGTLTDYGGKPTSVFGKEILASNGRLHKRLVNVFREKRKRRA